MAQAHWHVSPSSCCEQKGVGRGNCWAECPWWGPSTSYGDVDPPAPQASTPAGASEGRSKLCPSGHPRSECPRRLLHLVLFLCKDLLSCGPEGVKLTERETCELPLSGCLSAPFCPHPSPFSLFLSLSLDPPRPSGPPTLGIYEMALAGWWPSVCPEDPVVSSAPVQLERGGGHLKPPSWCLRVGSQGRKPWESPQPRTLDTLDSGFLRAPADSHHPWLWGTSSTRAGHQHRRQGQRVHHMHASVHTCLHRPHQHPHRGTGWLDVYTSHWPADTLMLPRRCGHMCTLSCAHVTAHTHMRMCSVHPPSHSTASRPPRLLPCPLRSGLQLLQTPHREGRHRSVLSSLGRDAVARPGWAGGFQKPGHTIPKELVTWVSRPSPYH